MKQKKINKTTDKIIYDRLYCRIPYTEDDVKLYQTKEVARLRHVSLSAAPPWVLPANICATKFDHSVGVAHLARVVGENASFKEVKKDLYFAALAHDLGTPPFSHISEIFQMELLGLNHEQFIDEVLQGSEFAQEVKKQGGNIERIARLVKGEEKPWSDVINGTIDIDNLDNSLRFGLTTGVLSSMLYSPEMLAKTFSLQNDKVVLSGIDKHELMQWDQCRKEVYEFVYSIDNNRPESMISRAIQLAVREGEIKRDYFFMTNEQAQEYLEKCNKRTSELVRNTRLWKFYPQVFRYSTTEPSEAFKAMVKETWNKQVLSDELCDYLKADPAGVCISAGMNKGFRKIHLQMIDEVGKRIEHTPQSQLAWVIQVYVHPRIAHRKKDIEAFVKDKIELS